MRLIVLVVVVVVATFLPTDAEIVSDELELTASTSPLDLVTAGEDVSYEAWRSAAGEAAAAAPTARARLLVGKVTERGLSYDPRDVRTGGIDLSGIGGLRARGDVVGLYVDGGALWVKIDERPAREVSVSRLAADVGVLLRAVFDSPHQSAWLTIDPPAEEEARRQYGIVKYGGRIENTHVGMVLFEADRLLKCLSIGFDNRTGEAVAPGPWHRSEWDFMPAAFFERRLVRETLWRRYWFTTEDAVVEVDADQRIARLVGPAITTKTENVRMAARGLAPAPQDGSDHRWTAYFNRNQEKYRTVYPILRELDELARWAALFVSLKQAGVIFQGVEIPDLYTAPTPVRTPVVTATKSRRTVEEEGAGVTVKRTREVIIFGGVGFDQVQPRAAELADVKAQWVMQQRAGSHTVGRLF
ncbi:hypothetical protein ACFL6X_04560 [Candidatus Latescibacterota bacterium]